jgi:hypothetical protein
MLRRQCAPLLNIGKNPLACAGLKKGLVLGQVLSAADGLEQRRERGQPAGRRACARRRREKGLEGLEYTGCIFEESLKAYGGRRLDSLLAWRRKDWCEKK